MQKSNSGIKSNIWSAVGSFTFFAGAIGHFCLVDFAWWLTGAGMVKQMPADLTERMATYRVEWDFFGGQQAMNIISAFSLWIVVSLSMFGIMNLLTIRALKKGHVLRYFTALICSIGSFGFFLLALYGMIPPAQIGGGLATLFFAFGAMAEWKARKKCSA